MCLNFYFILLFQTCKVISQLQNNKWIFRIFEILVTEFVFSRLEWSFGFIYFHSYFSLDLLLCSSLLKRFLIKKSWVFSWWNWKRFLSPVGFSIISFENLELFPVIRLDHGWSNVFPSRLWLMFLLWDLCLWKKILKEIRVSIKHSTSKAPSDKILDWFRVLIRSRMP